MGAFFDCEAQNAPRSSLVFPPKHNMKMLRFGGSSMQFAVRRIILRSTFSRLTIKHVFRMMIWKGGGMMDAAYTGERISSFRKERGMTQQELAELLHITNKAVSKWERGVSHS